MIMNAPIKMKGKASLREVTEVQHAVPAKARVKPRALRRTQAERTALSDARMFDAAMQLIVEQGTHATLLKLNGTYTEIYNNQILEEESRKVL